MSARRKVKKRKKARIERHPDGSKTIHLTDEQVELFAEQRQAFIDKFGREPRGDEPILFDPDADTPQPLDEEKLTLEIAARMKTVGLDPAYIHAFVQTGILLTEENMELFSSEDVAEFYAAAATYAGSR